MKKLFILITSAFLVFGCTKNNDSDVETTTVKTESGKEIQVPTTTTYYYYSSAYNGRPTTYLLVKDISTAELYRANDTLKSELTSDEKEDFEEAVKAVSQWNMKYNSNNINEFEEIRKIAPEGETNIYRSFGSKTPAQADRLLKECGEIADRLRRESGEKLP
jgi:hypothetical protein